jgi:CrcB protein
MTPNVIRLLLVCLGGALGTGLRYLTSLGAARWLGVDFPWGTLVVNLSGAFVIGLVQQVGLGSTLLSDDTRLFLTTGMMGGLTTYSTFSYETVRLAQEGEWGLAGVNVVATTAACLALCVLGMAVGRLLLSARG